METLYRKYRPQTWEELTGQTDIKLTLEKEITGGKLAHAYLFSGPRGSGKTTTARLLAKSLNCQNRKKDEFESCGKCSSCQEISNSRSIDVMEIDAASNSGVDNVRENIIDTARLSPTSSKFKIFIIDEVHMLSPSAFNALLKIIEEPPRHVFFILATTEPFKVPATILSRCQRFDFKKVEIEKMSARLGRIAKSEGVEVEKKVFDRIARQSDGCMRDAEGLLGQILALGEKKITNEKADLVLPRSDWNLIIEMINFIAEKNTREAIILLNKLVEDGVDLNNFANDMIQTLRLCLLYKLNASIETLRMELEKENIKKLRAASEKFNVEEIAEIMEIFIKQKSLIRSSSLQQLPLEIAIVKTTFQKIKKIDGSLLPKPQPPAVRPPLVNPSEIKAPEVKKIAASLSLEDVRAKWGLFLSKVQCLNHSLPFILKMGEPCEVVGRVVKIGFKFTFHRDKINEPKMRLMAENALNEVFNSSGLGLEGIFVAEKDAPPETIDKKPEKDNNALVASLVENFGGQLTE